jgi:CheY-like chemotaxis protein
MNLIVNARDAMPGGGRIEVETRVQTFDEEQCKKHSELAPGEYLLVSVADTGCGIPDEIRDRIFEPFFTTKPIGVGTGMGLAMVYGIVKNHGGSVGLETAEGSGTTFTVYLPLCASGALPREEPTVAGAHRGSGRILVVDDEDTVRETVQMMLSMLGYEVDTAADGLEAIEQFKKHAGQTRLVILDMTMPKMNGSECFRELRKIDPNVRVLLSTGHAIEGAAQDLLESGIAGLVQKPYIAQQLAQAIAEALA